MVSKISYNQFGYDDFVFENRNTLFGAYELRNSYWKRLFLALLLICSGFLLLILLIHNIESAMPTTPEKIRDIPPLTPLSPVTEPILPSLQSSGSPTSPAQNSVPVITTSDIDSTQVVMDTVDATDASNNGLRQGNGNDPGNGNGTGNHTTGVLRPDSLLQEDRDPEFMGGEEALVTYIGKNLRYPVRAERIGAEGDVYVSFVIEADGSVSNATVIRGMVVQECNQEALRVIQKMPRWKPGIYNGVPAPSKMRIPIRFSLSD